MRWLGFVSICVVFLVSGLLMAEVPVAEKPREVSIAVLVDYRDDTFENELAIMRAFCEASRVFEKNFGIKFAVKSIQSRTVSSNPQEVLDGDAVIGDMKSWEKNADVSVAFTRNNFFMKETEISEDGYETVVKTQKSGIAELLGNRSIIKIDSFISTTLVHELGHIFGADHVNEPRSVMSSAGFTPGQTNFDAKSKKVILANRDRKF